MPYLYPAVILQYSPSVQFKSNLHFFESAVNLTLIYILWTMKTYQFVKCISQTHALKNSPPSNTLTKTINKTKTNKFNEYVIFNQL
jgi:hypothetical protein